MALDVLDPGGLLTELAKLMPKCVEGVSGPCYENHKDVGSAYRGVVIYGPNDKVCMHEILLPGFNQLPRPFLGIIYLIWLIWLFSGVALASDTFMAGIEVITATTRKVKRKNDKGETVEVEVPVWNWVVANISLMALGTSAPEILLSIVETLITLDKPAGEIGPSCIVGSAAYNSLMITAVCTIALPDGVLKRISQLRVFVCTCVWSIWAYIWMLVCYKWWTPNEITIAEGFITLAQFFLLILNAWIIDVEPWKKKNRVVSSASEDPESQALPGSEGGQETQQERPHTLAQYRQLMAARQGTRHKKLQSLASMGPHHDAHANGHAHEEAPRVQIDPSRQQVLFRSGAYSFLESAKAATITIVRTGGDLNTVVQVAYKTQDGDAVAGLDYKATEGMVTFHAGETFKSVSIPLIDDDASEPDVSFFVVLELVNNVHGVVLAQAKVEITIVDDDDAGILGFELPDYEVAFNANHPEVEVTVVRRRGNDGSVSVEWETQDGTAHAGQDYEAAGGLVQFEAGECSRRLQVRMRPGAVPDPHKVFKMVLKNPTGGAELSNRHACNVHMVERSLTLVSGVGGSVTNKGGNSVAGKGGAMAKEGMELSAGGDGKSEEFDLKGVWIQQIKDSLGLPEPEEGEELSVGDYVMHYVNITWKLLLAIVIPPPDCMSGYPCFFMALAMIVGIVYLVDAAATLFGCVVGLKDFMTGISLVAMGTSLPDTLASRIAAIKDKDADAAIGNITGSNCVNVFLGLGLPWVFASIYYKAKGQKYITPAGDLSFSVMLFAVFSAVYVSVLMLRRYQGGELGGSRMAKGLIFGFFTALWFLYLILCGLLAYGHINGI